ncbi:MAG: hypothetical protein VB857_15825, partial [Pirellulaceae bacterium]
MKIKSKICRPEAAPTSGVVSAPGRLLGWGLLLLLCLLAMTPVACRSAKAPEENPKEKKEADKKDKEEPFSWIYSPYEVHVWVAMGPSARLTERHREDIQRRLGERALTWAGYGWKIDSEVAPLELNTDLTRNLALVTVESVVAQIRGPQPKKKTSKEKAAEKKAAEEKAAEEKAAEEKAAEKKAAEKQPAEKKPAEKKPAEKKPAEKKPAEKKPAERSEEHT